MVVFRDGDAVQRTVAAKEVRVKVGRKRCAAGDGTALAALVRSRIGRLGLRDYGSCSTRARDSAGLFVSSIRGERNRGQDGWVYKVGRRGATAGAADPSGAFGRGRLKRRAARDLVLLPPARRRLPAHARAAPPRSSRAR